MKKKQNQEKKTRAKTNGTLALANFKEPTLEGLKLAFANNYKRFIEIYTSDQPFQKTVKGKSYTAEHVVQLGMEIQTNTQLSLILAEKFFNKNTLCTETIKLQINWLVLYGRYLSLLDLHVGAFSNYNTAFELFKKYNNFLSYENDLPFQQQVQILFDKFNRLGTGVIQVGKGVEIFKDYAFAFLPEFTKKCGDSIIQFVIAYDRAVKDFTENRQDPEKKVQLQEQRASFFNLGRKLKNSIEEQGAQLSTEQQFYLVEMNYYLLTLSEITHPRKLWSVIYKNGDVIFLNNPAVITNKAYSLYFDYWQLLKKLYLEPTLSILEKIDSNELTTNLYVVEYWNPVLTKWLTVFFKAESLIKHWTEEQLRMIKLPENIESMYWKEIKDLVLKYDVELDFLVEKVGIFADFARGCNKKLSQNGFSASAKVLNQVTEVKVQIGQLKGKIKSLRTIITNQEEAQAKQNRKEADELVEAEAKEKKEKALQEEERRERKAARQDRVDYDWQSSEESESDEEKNSAPLIIANPNLESLEQVDFESLNLARTLKAKVSIFHDNLDKRSQQEIAIFPNEQNDTFREISHILIQYYDLVSLCEQHKTLSQKEEIKNQADLQLGIKSSQSELREASLFIHKTIQLVNTLYSEIQTRGQEGRDKKIYELGEAHYKNSPIKPTDAQIIEAGTRIFRNIGKAKRRRNQELSDHTKQRDFIELMQLPCLSLDYLQTKIRPYLFDNYNEGLNNFGHFSEEKTEFSVGRFNGMFAIILRHLYEEDGDPSHLQKALTHANKAYEYYFKRSNNSALSSISYQLAMISDKLAEQNPNDAELKTQARKYYQDTLVFNTQTKPKLDLDELEEIELRIQALEDNSPSATPLMLTM